MAVTQIIAAVIASGIATIAIAIAMPLPLLLERLRYFVSRISAVQVREPVAVAGAGFYFLPSQSVSRDC